MLYAYVSFLRMLNLLIVDLKKVFFFRVLISLKFRKRKRNGNVSRKNQKRNGILYQQNKETMLRKDFSASKSNLKPKKLFWI